MKYLLVTLFVSLLTFKASAQTHPQTDSLLGLGKMNPEEPHLPVSEVKNYIGKDVYVYVKVSQRKVISDTLSVLFIGAKYPKHQLVILLKGNKVNRELKIKEGDQSHFGGIVSTYQGKPAITIKGLEQMGERIQI